MSVLLAPDNLAVQSLIFYYARKNLHHHVITAATQALGKRTNDPQLLLWKAYGALQEERTAEAIRELEAIRGRQGIQLPVLICLKNAHECAKFVDREELNKISQEILAEEKANRESSFFLAAAVCLFLKDNKKAREYIVKTLEINPQYPQATSLFGWIDLLSGSETKARKSQKLFEEAKNTNGNDVDAALGMAAFFELGPSSDRAASTEKAIEELNKIVVKFTWFTPALSEKARLLLATGDWDQSMEAATRSLMLTPNNVEAQVITILFHLAKESRFNTATSKLTELVELLAEEEPRNSGLYLEIAAVLARFCGRQAGLVRLCIQLVSKAVQLQPLNSDALTELGYLHTLLGDFRQGLTSYQDAARADEANLTAVYGALLCQAELGQLDDAAQQLEFLTEIHGDAAPSADLAYLGALLAARRDKDPDKTLTLLDQAARIHLEAPPGGPGAGGVTGAVRRAGPLGELAGRNPDFLLQVARGVLGLVGPDPLPPGEAPGPGFGVCRRVLDAAGRVAPGSAEAAVLSATLQYLRRDLLPAQEAVGAALEANPADAAAHLLLAQILVEEGKAREAGQALEQALSHNFQVREWGSYLIAKAAVLEKQGEVAEAVKVLEAALALPVVPGQGLAGRAREGRGATEAERARAAVGLALAQAELGNTAEAHKVMHEAMRELAGSPHQAQVVLVSAELAIRRGDVQAGLMQLKAIGPTSAWYVKARVAAAKIHLNHRQDRRLFLRCFEDLVAGRLRSVATLALKADAHMRLQDADGAIEAYQAAIRLDPQGAADADLAHKIGQAYVMKHDFPAAASFYEEAIRAQPQRAQLRLSLADLYRSMGRPEKALAALEGVHAQAGDADTLEALSLRARALRVEARVHQRADPPDPGRYLDALQRARGVQDRLLGRLRGEAADLVKQQRLAAAELCCELAQVLEKRKAVGEAQDLYAEALKHDDRHVEARLSLARIHLDRDEVEAARQHCTALLQMDLAPEAATLMLADMMLRADELDQAIRYFSAMLDQATSINYGALEQLVRLVRRAGRLAEAPRFLRLAEKKAAGAAAHPGFHVCKGLLLKYEGKLAEALGELNQARKDPDWGVKAGTEMLDVYLDPSHLNTDPAYELPASLPEPDTVRAARALRRELEDARHLTPAQVSLYKAYELLVTGSRQSVEECLNQLSDVINLEKESAAGLVGLSYALILLKQEAKARNHLKRVAKMAYSSHEADALERGYLLYADMHVHNGKHDLAQELCRKCLQHNKSCGRAWEIQGLIFEKDAAYPDAAQVYDMAWQLDNQRNPQVGYKLAFNLLKAKRYVEAINVCNAVLKVHPNFPKMRKEILDKARASLRP